MICLPGKCTLGSQQKASSNLMFLTKPYETKSIIKLTIFLCFAVDQWGPCLLGGPPGLRVRRPNPQEVMVMPVSPVPHPLLPSPSLIEPQANHPEAEEIQSHQGKMVLLSLRAALRQNHHPRGGESQAQSHRRSQQLVQVNTDLIRVTISIVKHVANGQVVRAGVSVTWNVLSWSGGHEFESQSGRTWGAWYSVEVVLDLKILLAVLKTYSHYR